jgi:hypothetical protein
MEPDNARRNHCRNEFKKTYAITGEQTMSARNFFSAFSFIVLCLSLLQLSVCQNLQAATPEGTQPVNPSIEKKNSDAFSEAVKGESHPAPQVTPEKLSGGSNAAMAPFADIKVEKAAGDNAFTVAEIFSKNKELNGKTVRVQGKVVKYNSGIMGKNWIHIQDGTGDPMKSTHDLVATSSETATVGEVITVQGRLAADKDFGAGYSYVAIIEEAQIKK